METVILSNPHAHQPAPTELLNLPVGLMHITPWYLHIETQQQEAMEAQSSYTGGYALSKRI